MAFMERRGAEAVAKVEAAGVSRREEERAVATNAKRRRLLLSMKRVWEVRL